MVNTSGPFDNNGLVESTFLFGSEEKHTYRFRNVETEVFKAAERNDYFFFILIKFESNFFIYFFIR